MRSITISAFSAVALVSPAAMKALMVTEGMMKTLPPLLLYRKY
jgi:hypothetical protein